MTRSTVNEGIMERMTQPMVQQHEVIDETRQTEMGPPLLISVPQAARLLGIGATFAWELVHSGAIPSIKLGRRVLVPRQSLERRVGQGWLTNNPDDRKNEE